MRRVRPARLAQVALTRMDLTRMALALSVAAVLAVAPAQAQTGMYSGFNPHDPEELEMMMAARAPLADIANGQVWKPMKLFDLDDERISELEEMGEDLAMDLLSMAISAAFTGGASLAGDALAMGERAASAALADARQAMAAGTLKQQIAKMMQQADAIRRTSALMPDSDRPAEARALQSAVGQAPGTAIPWNNPQTQASGVVTVVGQKQVGPMSCVAVQRSYAKGPLKRGRPTDLCRYTDGQWYPMAD